MVQVMSALLYGHVGAIYYLVDVPTATCRLRMLASCAGFASELFASSELERSFSECDSRVALKDLIKRGESFLI